MKFPIANCEFATEVARLIGTMERLSVQATIRREEYAGVLTATCTFLRHAVPESICIQSYLPEFYEDDYKFQSNAVDIIP